MRLFQSYMSSHLDVPLLDLNVQNNISVQGIRTFAM